MPVECGERLAPLSVLRGLGGLPAPCAHDNTSRWRRQVIDAGVVRAVVALGLVDAGTATAAGANALDGVDTVRRRQMSVAHTLPVGVHVHWPLLAAAPACVHHEEVLADFEGAVFTGDELSAGWLELLARQKRWRRWDSQPLKQPGVVLSDELDVLFDAVHEGSLRARVRVAWRRQRQAETPSLQHGALRAASPGRAPEVARHRW